MNLVTNNGNFYTSYRYFIASYIVKNLIEKINNGQTYLLNKINNLAFLLGKTTIEPLYIIDFLECHELFYDFVFPKKHPILRRTKNMSEKSEFLDF